MTVKCSRCGVESEIEAAFTKESSWLGLRTRRYCPDCFQKRVNRSFWTLLIALIVFVVASLASLVLFPDVYFGRTLWAISGFLLAVGPLVILHELAHTAAAHLLGMRVFRVIIGYGKLLLSKKLGRINFEFRLLPLAGITIFGSPPSPGFKTRVFLVALAGPAVHLLVAPTLVAAWLFLGFYSTYIDPGVQMLSDFISSLQWANIALLVFSLFPYKSATPYGANGSDGLLIFQIPFWKETDLQEHFASYYIQESLEAYYAHDQTAAVQWIERGIKAYPTHPNIQNTLGFLQLADNCLPEARETFVKILNLPGPLKPELKLIVLNNIAYTGILTGDPSLLPEADLYSAEAYKNSPWSPPITGTRGAVLVELGQLEAGVALLKQALEKQTDPRAKASNACYLAIAEYRRGNSSAAQKYLEAARSLDRRSYLLEKVERMVSARS